MRVAWIADALHAAHLQLVPLDGWQGRGRELSTVNGVVLHHTATPPTSSDAGVAKILRDGRADLPGPLSQLGLDRQGRFWLIADGKCNHNGLGMWANQAIGIEAYNDGKGEPWPAVQLDAFQRGTAAILRCLGLNEGHALGHRETDPGRKTDPKGVDLEAFRRRVAQLLRPTVEDDVYEYKIVAIPQPDSEGRQKADHDINGNLLGTFNNDVVVSIKANNDGQPVKAVVEPWGFGPSLVLSFVGLNGQPAPTGNVGVIIGHPPR